MDDNVVGIFLAVVGLAVVLAIGLALLPMIFYPMLGFSDARYQGPPAS